MHPRKTPATIWPIVEESISPQKAGAKAVVMSSVSRPVNVLDSCYIQKSTNAGLMSAITI